MPDGKPIRNKEGYITNAADLSCDDVIGEKVLCPVCGGSTFKHWSFGWDRHAETKCTGISGSTSKERKAAFKDKLRYLFR